VFLWAVDCVASCDRDRDSTVACLGPERLCPHQVPGPMGTGAISARIKRPGCEAGSPSSNAEAATPARVFV
jgi:hypothetical protein